MLKSISRCQSTLTRPYSTAYIKSMEKPYGYDQFEQFIARKNIKRFLKSVDSFHMPGLVGAEDKLFPFLEREETIRPTVAMMCDRWKAGIFSDKSNNPLMGFHSVPGGGKSYLIDEFVRLNFKDAEVMKRFGTDLKEPEWFAQEFANSIRLAITFNRQMSGALDYFASNPRLDLFSRLLYSPKINFPDFQANLKGFDQLVSEEANAIYLICYHYMQHTRCPPPRVIIFLDEILKARNPDESLHLVCEFMEIFSGSDLCKSVDVLSTTLDPEVIINLGTKSNRRASVAPLPAFRNIRKLFPDSDVAYHLAIRAGGHARSLYYLRRLLDTDPIYRELNNLKPLGRSLTKEEADNKIAGNDEKLEGLLKKARKSMFESLMIDLNEAVTALLSDFVNASDQSSKSKILNGTYLNSLSDLRGRFIPRVSIFQLLNVGIKESTVPLTEALVDFIRKDTLTSLEGKRFESFHAYWERLMHECYRYRNIKVISLPEYYRAAITGLTVGTEELEMKITNATKSIKVYEKSFIKNFFKLEMLTMDAKNFIDGKLIYHCVPPLKKGRNQEENPAFDFCHVFEHAKLPRTKVILHCETRYSQSKKGDKKPRIHFKADILQKQRKLMNSYINVFRMVVPETKTDAKVYTPLADYDCNNKLIKFLDPKLKEMWDCDAIVPLLVVVAPRKFTPDPEEIGKLGNSFISVAVIDLDGLQKAYGPSICSTQLFHSTEDLNRRFAIMGE